MISTKIKLMSYFLCVLVLAMFASYAINLHKSHKAQAEQLILQQKTIFDLKDRIVQQDKLIEATSKALVNLSTNQSQITNTHETIIKENTKIVEKAIQEGKPDDEITALIYQGVIDSWCVGKEDKKCLNK